MGTCRIAAPLGPIHLTCFRFDVLPRVPLRVIWHAADEDFPPNAVFLFQTNVVHLLPPEDIVVLSELVVGEMSRAVR